MFLFFNLEGQVSKPVHFKPTIPKLTKKDRRNVKQYLAGQNIFNQNCIDLSELDQSFAIWKEEVSRANYFAFLHAGFD